MASKCEKLIARFSPIAKPKKIKNGSYENWFELHRDTPERAELAGYIDEHPSPKSHLTWIMFERIERFLKEGYTAEQAVKRNMGPAKCPALEIPYTLYAMRLEELLIEHGAKKCA